MRPITDDEDLQSLHRDGAGFVFNDFAGLGRGGAETNVLHRALCNQVARSKVSVGKFFFDELDEAEAWLVENRGPEGVNWKRCRCMRGPVAPMSRSSRAVEVDDAQTLLAPFREPEVESFMIEHLTRAGFDVTRQGRVASGIIDLVAIKRDRRLIVEVKGEDAGGYTSAQMNLLIAIGQIASRMTDEEDDFAIAIPVTPDFNRALSKFRGSRGLERLGASLFLVRRDGAVSELRAEEIAQYIEPL